MDRKSKTPCPGFHWKEEATTDPNVIRGWAEAHPEANYAYVLNGILAVDVDPRNGGDSWPGAALLGEPTVVSGRGDGGAHYLFAVPSDRAPRPRCSHPGVDVKTEPGAYLVGPGSVHAEGAQGRYEGQLPRWTALPSLPEGLIAALGTPPVDSHASLMPRGSTVPRTSTGPLERGSRNSDLYRRACSWRGQALPVEEAYSKARELQEAADTDPADPFTWVEAQSCVDSAYKHPSGRKPDYRSKPVPRPEGSGEEDVAPSGTSDSGVGRRRSTADDLVELALRDYEITQADDRSPIAIPHSGGRTALPLRGKGSFTSALSYEYVREHSKVPNAAALTDALNALTGYALQQQPVQLWNRVARAADDAIEIDLGDETGRAVRVGSEGWHLVPRSTVVFRRTGLTGAFPEPTRGGEVDTLRQMVNIGDEDWDQLVAWFVAAFLPEIPHPVLLLGEEQGTGKSDCTEMLVNLLDPSPAPKRAAPRDEKQWHTSAAGSCVVALDNLSSIPHWLSDAICRVVTGDGDVRRALFTDGDLYVSSIRRVILLNGIGLTALRGDLADRLMRIQLQPIPRSARREHRVLMDLFDQRRPELFGALLDLLSQVLAVQAGGGVQLDSLPRLADFARVVAAVDKVRGSAALASFLDTQDEVAAQVAADDPLTGAIEQLLDRLQRDGGQDTGEWKGTAAQLAGRLNEYAPHPMPKDWPSTAARLGQRLQQLAPALRARGIQADQTRRTRHAQKWSISYRGAAAQQALFNNAEV